MRTFAFLHGHPARLKEWKPVTTRVTKKSHKNKTRKRNIMGIKNTNSDLTYFLKRRNSVELNLKFNIHL